MSFTNDISLQKIVVSTVESNIKYVFLFIGAVIIYVVRELVKYRRFKIEKKDILRDMRYHSLRDRLVFNSTFGVIPEDRVGLEDLSEKKREMLLEFIRYKALQWKAMVDTLVENNLTYGGEDCLNVDVMYKMLGAFLKDTESDAHLNFPSMFLDAFNKEYYEDHYLRLKKKIKELIDNDHNIYETRRDKWISIFETILTHFEHAIKGNVVKVARTMNGTLEKELV